MRKQEDTTLFSIPENKKIRVIIDTDAACEADDPEAVTAYLNRVGGSADSRSAALLARSISLSLASGYDCPSCGCVSGL